MTNACNKQMVPDCQSLSVQLLFSFSPSNSLHFVSPLFIWLSQFRLSFHGKFSFVDSINCYRGSPFLRSSLPVDCWLGIPRIRDAGLGNGLISSFFWYPPSCCVGVISNSAYQENLVNRHTIPPSPSNEDLRD